MEVLLWGLASLSLVDVESDRGSVENCEKSCVGSEDCGKGRLRRGMLYEFLAH